MFTSSMAVVITFLLMGAVFYHIFQGQVMEDLRLYAYALAAGFAAEGGGDYESAGAGHDAGDMNVRSTVISPRGEVIYDSSVNVGGLDNHAGRPEVQAALRYGSGRSIRQSDTMKHNTYYFTLLLQDGNVLRVSRESHNIWSILYSSIPVIVAVVFALLALCAVISRFFTRSLIEPIDQMAADMDHIDEKDIYEELQPFARTIRRQHDAVVDYANIRQAFSANVSHELKTPLTAISGYSELIESGMATGQDATRFAAEIHKSAKRLLTLINDTIRLSELDVPDKRIPMEPLNLYDIVSDSAAMLQIRAEERDVSLSMTGSGCMIRGDRQMIEELVYNLCDNAICYTNAGGSVYISVERTDKKAVFRVKDTGIGIPKECQDRVFERFYRVDKSRSKSTGGTGLGLAIVKHIVAVHRAEMTLYSEPDKGTDISVSFDIVQGLS